MGKKWIRNILTLFFLALFLYAAVSLFMIWREYRQSDALYDAAQTEFLTAPEMESDQPIIWPPSPLILPTCSKSMRRYWVGFGFMIQLSIIRWCKATKITTLICTQPMMAPLTAPAVFLWITAMPVIFLMPTQSFMVTI